MDAFAIEITTSSHIANTSNESAVTFLLRTMDSATSTGVETSATAATTSSRRNETDTTATRNNEATNGSAAAAANGPEKPTVYLRKYRHLAAIHSQSKPSTLGHDAHTTPSFIGFRNLMIIVLSTSFSHNASLSRIFRGTNVQ